MNTISPLSGRQPAMPVPTDTPHRRYEMTNYFGQVYTVYCTEQETPFPDGRLITSRTNTQGIITHANEAFVLMSGWTREELIGSHHSILRHPDMPKAAFADLWATIQRGEKWHGYVKNLRKDGGYYWVYATAIPNIRQGVLMGYTSVRRKPSRDQINACIELYAQMLAQE